MAINRAQEKIHPHVRKIDDIWEACNDIPDEIFELEGIYFRLTHTSLQLHIPWDPALYQRLRRLLGLAWRRTDTYQGEYARGMVFLHRTLGARLEIWLSATTPGSTCRRVQVGEREIAAHTVPVYEVVCD